MAGSLFLYAQSLDFDFVHFDDQTILTDHPNRYDETSLTKSARAIFLTDFPREEPLVIRDLSWALDARLFGFSNAEAYHRTNILLNALVVGLLFLLLRRSGLSGKLAGGVALVFALLPIHVEVVSWVMGRKDLLVAIFVLLGLLAQHSELESRTPRSKAFAYGLTLLCLALALGSKISAISFWLVLGAHRFFHPYLTGQRGPTESLQWRRDAIRTLPALVPHIMLSFVVFSWYHGRLSEFGIILQGGPAALGAEHLINIASFLPLIAGEYLHHLFLPSELSSFYRWPHVAIPLTRLQEFASLLWALGICSAIVYCLRRRRDLAFYPLMSLGLMAPYTGVFYVGFWYADRYLYLASAGLLCVVAILLGEILTRMPNLRLPALSVVALFALTGAFQVWQGQTHWRNNEALWTYEMSREEPALLAFQALARHYAKQAEIAPAENRRDLALHSKAVIARGLQRHAALGLESTTYPIPERVQLARLHALAGRADAIPGAPPMMRAAHYRLAFDTAPERLSAILLSGALFEAAQAMPESEGRPLVEESFDYFLAFVALSSSDPSQRRASQILLETNYGSRFPYLEARIAEAKRIHFQ